ncbi:MAG: glycogen synthase GlgA [Candidatus Bipolaricaulota bacterium]
MRVLFVAAEVTPFAKTGGLADVALALPRALASLGVEVLVVMPKHRAVAAKAELLEAARFEVALGSGTKPCVAYSAVLPDSRVPIYFLGNDGYFDRPAIYGEGGEYHDALERFAFLSRGALELAEALRWKADLVHANDWHTALLPAYVRSARLPHTRDAKTVLTIHNLSYQGSFPCEQAAVTGLPEDVLASYVRGDRVNLLRGGILTTDLVTTVSPTYAKEILDAGDGLEEELRSRKEALHGVINGIDDRVWDPAADPFLWATYTRGDLAGKARNKAELQKALGLAEDPGAPLVGAISRLAEQKGFDLILGAWDRIMDTGVQFVVLGTGSPDVEAFFRAAAERSRSRVASLITFSEEWAHRIEAASDIFLMPSRFEPCGLNQQYSLRYGTVPVVRATGGLRDTILDADADPQNGNGFSFEPYTADAVLDTLARALAVYRQAPVRWQDILRRGMDRDLSWEGPARAYRDLYRQVVC